MFENPFEAPESAEPRDWQSLVQQVEARVQTLADGLEELRASVKLLSSYAPQVAITPEEFTADPPLITPAVADTVVAPEETPSWMPSFETVPDEVSQVTAEEPPVWSPHSYAMETNDEEAAESAASDVAELVSAISAEEEAAREEVRRTVERARAELWQSPPEEEQPAEDEDPREAVRRAVEQARAEMEGAANLDGGSWPKADGGFQTTRGSLGNMFGGGSDWSAKPVSMSGAPLEADLRGDAATDEEPSRDWSHTPMQMPSHGSRPDIDELSHPPSIVIEDPVGRVDLARVYETLDRLEFQEQPTLQNYTPHAVTVGLASRSSAPSNDALAAAVRAVFGRSCEITADGQTISVKLSNNQERVA